jgi:hypothetical protein
MMASDEKSDKVHSGLSFDGEDKTKWESWNFKMLAYAQKRGYEAAYTTVLEFASDDETKWTDAEKANKVLMKAAWSQLALCVLGHALKIVTRVKSKNPKEAWDRLKEEFKPAEIDNVVDLQRDIGELAFPETKKNPVEWIEDLEAINERIGLIEDKYQKDDFLMIAYIFSLLPKTEYESYITSNKKEIQTMTIRVMKKSIAAHWKQFIKENDKAGEVFYGGESGGSQKTKGYKGKKKFKGDCRNCGK